MKLDVILRTCHRSLLDDDRAIHMPQLKRICGVDRSIMILKCLQSLIDTINNTKIDTRLIVLDDHSEEKFLDKIKSYLITCNKSTELVSLKDNGFNNSAHEQFKLATQAEELVYTVEDDYLHENQAITNMLSAYSYFTDRFKDNVLLNPFDCPFRYEHGKEEPTILFHDGHRYWRHIKHTALTVFTSSNVIKKHWEIFDKMALEYPRVTEDTSINLLYKSVFQNDGDILVFNPIPSVAYHLSYQEPTIIKTRHRSWRDLWIQTTDYE